MDFWMDSSATARTVHHDGLRQRKSISLVLPNPSQVRSRARIMGERKPPKRVEEPTRVRKDPVRERIQMLRERIKELLEDRETPVQQDLAQFLQRLPSAWQYNAIKSQRAKVSRAPMK